VRNGVLAVGAVRLVDHDRATVVAATRESPLHPGDDRRALRAGRLGMAIYATNAKRVTDEMFIEAAHVVADQLKLGMLFPPQSNILEVKVQTALGRDR
jgi:malic enzyme